MTDETKPAPTGPANAPADVDASTAKVKADIEKTENETDQIVENAKTEIETTTLSLVSEAESRRAAVERFIQSSHPSEILKMIEDEAKVLLQLIHGIPNGVPHAWHSLAAEISARRL